MPDDELSLVESFEVTLFNSIIHSCSKLCKAWEMIACVKDGVHEYYQEDIVDFDSEIDLEEDE